jgi:hypothetical protein
MVGIPFPVVRDGFGFEERSRRVDGGQLGGGKTRKETDHSFLALFPHQIRSEGRGKLGVLNDWKRNRNFKPSETGEI